MQPSIEICIHDTTFFNAKTALNRDNLEFLNVDNIF